MLDLGFKMLLSAFVFLANGVISNTVLSMINSELNNEIY